MDGWIRTRVNVVCARFRAPTVDVIDNGFVLIKRGYIAHVCQAMPDVCSLLQSVFIQPADLAYANV
jgi:hypothetical protein